jgi:hypothetical protein
MRIKAEKEPAMPLKTSLWSTTSLSPCSKAIFPQAEAPKSNESAQIETEIISLKYLNF